MRQKKRPVDAETPWVTEDGDDQDDAASADVARRAEAFVAAELCCRSACISFLCAWMIFAMLFGTGKIFSLAKEADAVTID